MSCPVPKPITIVGGGLSGLALGNGLRQEGVPVTLWEAGHFPRHRVCGELISGLGPAMLETLGLSDLFQQARAHSIQDAVFVAGREVGPVRPIRQSWSVS